jgi:hypothetical protein
MKEVNDFSFHLFGGVMPVINSVKYKDDFQAEPNSLDWTQGVADLMNIAHTVAKKRYVNYHFGISLNYKRFGLNVLMHRNLSQNLGKPLEYNNQKFQFRRNTASLRAIISYCLIKGD